MPSEEPNPPTIPLITDVPSTIPSRNEYILSTLERVSLLIVVCGFVAGFWLAATLTPDPRGFGTHQSLGLPPCSFRLLFGIHCPSCGGTTAFAHFMRGEWWSAFNSNMSAFGLALVCAISIPWGIASVIRGRLWRIQNPFVVFLWITAVLGGIALLQWGFKMMFVPMI